MGSCCPVSKLSWTASLLAEALYRLRQYKLDFCERGTARIESASRLRAVRRRVEPFRETQCLIYGGREDDLVMTLTAAATVHSCGITGTSTGRSWPLRYVLMFVVGLDGLPGTDLADESPS